MTLAEKVAAVELAEQRCQAQREAAQAALAHLKSEARRSATPGRIVVSGLALGFAAGFREPKAGPSLAGKVLGGPVFSMVLEAVLPGLLAGLTAAAGLKDEVEEVADLADEEPRDKDDDVDAAA